VSRTLALLVVLLLALAPASAAAAPSRPSLPYIEDQVMCPTCGIPLIEADSPQADREKVFIQGLLAQGLSFAQIKQQLVAQYGTAVLALPQDKGFDATVYVIPIVLVALLLLTLVLALPRWRRRGIAPTPDAGIPLRPEDAARLDADLARFDL
jgi:cytochrome c-type biogenesis protein CcmH/NrfF